MRMTSGRQRVSAEEQADHHAALPRAVPAVIQLQMSAGNRAVSALVTSGSAAPVIQRCGPLRPDCGCSEEERAAAERQSPEAPRMATASSASSGCGRPVPPDVDGWMAAPPARFAPPERSCGLEDVADTSEEAPEALSDSDEVPVRESGRPHAGDATIVCNGADGYRVDMQTWAGAPCGIEGCVRRHEEQHIRDWRSRWPDGCKGKKNGDTIPLGGPGYAAFLKASECSAYTVELNCVRPLAAAAKTEPCKTRLKDHMDDTDSQKKSYC